MSQTCKEKKKTSKLMSRIGVEIFTNHLNLNFPFSNYSLTSVDEGKVSVTSVGFRFTVLDNSLKLMIERDVKILFRFNCSV